MKIALTHWVGLKEVAWCSEDHLKHFVVELPCRAYGDSSEAGREEHTKEDDTDNKQGQY